MKNNESLSFKSFVKSLFSNLLWKAIEIKQDEFDQALVLTKQIANIHSIKIKDIISKYNFYLDKINDSNNNKLIKLYNKAYEHIESLDNPKSVFEFISNLYNSTYYIDEAVDILEGRKW